jgi:hypothetical protein
MRESTYADTADLDGVDVGGSVYWVTKGAAQPKRSPKSKSALPAVSRSPQVVAKLIRVELEDKPPKRRAAPASTAVEGRTGLADRKRGWSSYPLAQGHTI